MAELSDTEPNGCSECQRSNSERARGGMQVQRVCTYGCKLWEGH